MTPATDEELGEVRRLLEKATPGPWEADRGAERRDRLGWAIILAPDGKTLFDTINSDAAVMVDPDYEGAWRDETGEANAALIVTAINALPRILSRLERERERRVPEGWRLVPEELTREMWAASADALLRLRQAGNHNLDAMTEASHRALLAAAPEPPAHFATHTGEGDE